MLLLANLLQGLYDGVIMPFEDGLSEQYIAEIGKHHIFSQIYHLASCRSLLPFLPKQFVSALQFHHVNVFGQNLFVRHNEDLILKAFESERVEVIPLKGTRFAERFFGNPGARGTSDIDILIHREDLPSAAALLKKLGFSEPEPFNPRHYHCIVRKQTKHGEILVEIHWSIIKQHTSNFHVRDAWTASHALNGFHYVRALSIPYTFYSVCLHGANHEMKSWKPYLDIVQLIHVNGDDISYDWLVDQSKQDKTFRRIQMVLTRVYDAFPSLHKIKPPGLLYCSGRGRRPFGLLQYDSAIHRWRVVREWVWPELDIARWYLMATDDVPVYRLYMKIYYQRLRKATRIVSNR